MYMKLKDGKSKVFCMSYDDGFFHDIRFVETINKYGLKATLHLNTGTWWDEDMVRDRPRGKLKLSEAKALYIGGPHELACHGQHHRFMEQLKPQEVLTEILENRRDIERDFGVLSLGLGMPYGTYTEDVIEMAKMCGMEYVRAGGATNKLTFPTDWYHFRTTCRHNHPQLMEFAHQFVEEMPNRNYDINWMFCVGGHSWEFNRHKNWELLEELCELVSGKEDIWYATILELRNYAKAYESLQVSVDNKIVHNPTATDVWFEEKKEIYCVKAGETLYL